MVDRTTEAEARLRAMLQRVFADGVLEPHEKDELRQLYTQGGLTAPRVRVIFGELLRTTYARVMEDGVVTDDEKRELRSIVDGLKLPPEMVPDEVRRVLG